MAISMAVYKWILLTGVVVIVVASIALFLGSPTARAAQYDDFAKCLNEKGVKMYGAY